MYTGSRVRGDAIIPRYRPPPPQNCWKLHGAPHHTHQSITCNEGIPFVVPLNTECSDTRTPPTSKIVYLMEWFVCVHAPRNEKNWPVSCSTPYLCHLTTYLRLSHLSNLSNCSSFLSNPSTVVFSSCSSCAMMIVVVTHHSRGAANRGDSQPAKQSVHPSAIFQD